MTDIFEQHLKSAGSTDLTPLETRCDIDLLTAAGFVAQHYALGMALYQMKYQHDMGKTDECLRGLYPIVRRYMEANRVKARPIELIREVLIWWVDDICRHCDGRRLTLIPDTARLSAKPCSDCHGSGLRALSGQNYEARRHIAMQIEIFVEQVRTALRRT